MRPTLYKARFGRPPELPRAADLSLDELAGAKELLHILEIRDTPRKARETHHESRHLLRCIGDKVGEARPDRIDEPRKVAIRAIRIPNIGIVRGLVVRLLDVNSGCHTYGVSRGVSFKV